MRIQFPKKKKIDEKTTLKYNLKEKQINENRSRARRLFNEWKVTYMNVAYGFPLNIRALYVGTCK